MSNNSTPPSHFQDWYDRGFGPWMIPVHKGGKAPIGHGWQARGAAQPEDIQRWDAQQVNLGIRTGRLIFVDSDILDAGLADEVQALVFRDLGPAPVRDRGGVKRGYLYRLTDGEVAFRKRTIYRTKDVKLVELLALGQQFVAEGEVGGDRYRWSEKGFKFWDLTQVTQAEIDACLEAVRQRVSGFMAVPASSASAGTVDKKKPGKIEITPTALKSVMSALPNDVGYDEWIEIGMALAGVSGYADWGREVWHAWSSKWSGYDVDVTEAKWKSFVGDGVFMGLERLRKELQARGMDGALGVLRVGNAKTEFDVLAVSPGVKGEVGHSTSAAKNTGALKRVLSGTMLNEPYRGVYWLVRDVLPMQSIGLLSGEYGTYKTFLGLDLALHVAAGRAWHGRKVRQGRVLYFCMESGEAARTRVAAWAKHWGMDMQGIDFHLLPDRYNFRSDPKWITGVIEEIKQGYPDPALVVVDTLARGLAGGNENASEDMGAVFDNCTRLREGLKCTVMLVHHFGKDVTKGSRGHTIMAANADFEFHTQTGLPLNVELVTNKQKEGEGTLKFGFTLHRLVMGQDVEGDEVSTLVAVPVASIQRPGRSTAWTRRVRDTFEALGGTLADGLTLDALVEETARAADKPERMTDRRKAAREAVDSMKTDGRLAVDEHGNVTSCVD